MNVFKWIMICMMALCFFLFDNKSMGFSSSTHLYTHITYMFAHANLFHLATNLIVFGCMFTVCDRLNIIKETLVVSFISAVLSSFILMSDVITVGLSGFIYAMMSAPFAAIFSRRLIITNRRIFTQYVIIVAVNLLVGFFVRHVNATIHVASFLIGFVLLSLHYRFMHKIKTFVQKIFATDYNSKKRL
jgi:membrane associated rhomboid family serine protease